MMKVVWSGGEIELDQTEPETSRMIATEIVKHLRSLSPEERDRGMKSLHEIIHLVVAARNHRGIISLATKEEIAAIVHDEMKATA